VKEAAWIKHSECDATKGMVLIRISRLSAQAILLAIAAGTVSGCRSAQQLTPQQAEGKHLYQVRCAHCHEDNDLALKKIPPDLHGLFDRKLLPSGIPATDAAVANNVLKGRGMMPGFAGRFTQEQMDALLAYLHTGLR
jgi:mono/diheme cytochrome c family protein